jgi:endonuclease/exonuclease/phosphatase family metal-dependent hydrolase
MNFPRPLAGAALALVLIPAAAQAKAKPDVTVMSRNLYLGADIITLASATDEALMEQKAQQLYSTVQQTNFPLRARRIAQEIRKTRPDAIAIQEVARYYQDGKSTLDWMKLLQGQLKKAGQHYRQVAREDEIDVTVRSAAGYDLRLVLGNAVLVRSGKSARIKRVKGLHGVFKAQISVPLANGTTVNLKRGYAGLDGRIAGKRFRFLDPHAEAYSSDVAGQQFAELLAGPAKSKKIPTIIAGDFNSDPADSSAAGYKNVIAAGFTDTGKRAATCCQDENLLNPVSKLDQWIDHIVVRPKARVLWSKIVGNRPSDRISGLWPSDHAGVVAKLRLR